ncbi:hypothetical protein V8E55_008314 [Tylopilus felleus]
MAFSFGWVAYVFSNLITTLNGGTLMPQPEIPCLVVNANNRYEFVLSRWATDRHFKVKQIVDAAQENDRRKDRNVNVPRRNKAGLCISVYSCSRPAGKPVHDFVYYSGFIIALLQLAISSIPFGISSDWVPFLLTFFGIKEKKWEAPLSKKWVILTRGNGAQHTIVINSEKGSMDFEALAALEPTAQHAWYLIAVGSIGMAYNVYVAALGIHLNYIECFADRKVMRALQAVETKNLGVGTSMLPTFFPGELCPEEQSFWDKQKK